LFSAVLNRWRKEMNKIDGSAYARAGVDIEAAKKAIALMKTHILSTHNERVLSSVGSFAGLFDVSFLKEYQHPILVSSIDGVGTKIMIAEMMDSYTVGQCVVNHCVNDTIVQGAIPLVFFDYMAGGTLEPEVMKRIVEQMAVACRAARIPIITGETAEMPGVYRKGQHDVVGCVVGVVEKDAIIDGSQIKEGDILIGLLSDGLHTNGYSLARLALFETAGFLVTSFLPELGCTVGEELLKVHKSYYDAITLLLGSGIEVHGIAHITGEGFPGNIGRLLRDGLCAEISYQWERPPVFRLIQKLENVADEEMRKVFNLGVGMVLIVPPEQADAAGRALAQCGESTNLLLGEIKKTQDEKKVVFTY